MTLIKQKDFITKKANLNELKYRNNLASKDYRTNTWKKWVSKIKDGRLEYVKEIKKLRIKGKVLELGAGTCWLTSEISKIKAVDKTYALDFSEYLLSKIAPKVIDYLKGDKKKIVRVVGDFNKTRFNDKYFDFVIIDAALHHATDLSHMLKEAKRILKKNGTIIAIREPILPKMRPDLKEKFGKEDKAYGITENIYSKKEWVDYFNNAGLKLKLKPFIPKKRFVHKILNYVPFKWLNGYIFAHYIFIARRKE